MYLWHRSPILLCLFCWYCLNLSGTICRDAWQLLQGVYTAPKIFKHLSLSNSLDIQISHLANKLGFPVDRIFITSKYMRSVRSHLSSGLFPFFKRIIIRDDCLRTRRAKRLSIALAAREMGHWYLNHGHKKMLVELSFDLARAILYCFLAFTPAMYTAFGFETTRLNNNPKKSNLNRMPLKNPSLKCHAIILN